MKTSDSSDLAPRTIPQSASLEIRLQLVADAQTGKLRGIDCRLWRKVQTPEAAGAFAATQAGFRIGVDALRPLGVALLAFADALEGDV
jgi:hypothetical protein